MLASSRRLSPDGQDVANESSKPLHSLPNGQVPPDVVSMHCTDAGFTPSPSIRTTFSGDTISDSSSGISSGPSLSFIGSSASDTKYGRFDIRSNEGSYKSGSTWRIPTVKSLTASAGLSNPSIGDLDRKKMEDNTGVLYDLYFTAPPKLTASAAIRYHLTTRNVLAFLLDRSIVGLNFAQALRDLQHRLEIYMPPKTHCAKLIVRFLVRRRLHNVSNNPSTAAGLLAWSEDVGVRWLEGWREAFVHCCGMYARLAETPEYSCISEISKGLLEKAHTELQLRLKAAEKRLLTFKLDDIWLPLTISNAASTKTTNNTAGTAENAVVREAVTDASSMNQQLQQQQQARAAFDSFRHFLRQHYEKAYKSWRTRVAQENCNDSWLTRKLTCELQADFGALYDYLVDREAVWGLGGDIVKNIPAGRGQRADFVIATPATADKNDRNNSSVAQMVRLLRHYDYRCNHTPLQHPFPLLPASVPVENGDGQNGQQAAPRRGLSVFTMSRTTRTRDKRVYSAYTSANNAHFYSSSSSTKQHDTSNPNPMDNPLVEAFRKHEKTEQLRSLDPRSARVGRWIMLYSVLQVLAEISVDTPHLFFNDVPYFLNPRLSNTPPWAMEDRKRQPAVGKMVVGLFDEASKLYSYCWLAPKRWSRGAQMNDSNRRCDDGELVDPIEFVTAPRALLAIRSERDDSFAASSSGVKPTGVSGDTKTTKHAEVVDAADTDAVDKKPIRAESNAESNDVSSNVANVPLDKDLVSSISASNPSSLDNPSVRRAGSEPNGYNSRHIRSPSYNIDNVDEENDEDFSFFNNVSHERQGMPGFRAPLRAAIARSRSKSFLRAGDAPEQAQSPPQAQQQPPLPPQMQITQTIRPVQTDGEDSQIQSASLQDRNLKPSDSQPAKINSSEIPDLPAERVSDGIVASTVSAPKKRSAPNSRPGASPIPNFKAISNPNFGAFAVATVRSARPAIPARTGTDDAAVGRSDYAPPAEW